MGKRKRAKPPPKKAKPKVAQVFDCPFCGKTESCHCRMDIDHSLGTILCDSCGAKYSMRINRLTDPIDVYSEWIDSALPHAPPEPCFIFCWRPLSRASLLLLFCVRAVSDAVNQGGGGVAAAAPRRAANEDREGETEWHGEEDADPDED